MSIHSPPPITGLVLAGGRATRMGEVDKGLQPFQGEPMVAHALRRLTPQVGEILINANRNLPQYEAFGHRVIADDIEGFAGPLAGLHRGMTEAASPLLVSVPCDSPFLPPDLVSRLYQAQIAAQADLAVAKTFDQPQPVFCLVKCSLAPHLHAFLQSGQRKIDRWYRSLKVVEVSFDDQVEAFANINTLDELKSLEKPSHP